MNRTTEILNISSREDLPRVTILKAIPRTKILRLVFGQAIRDQREEIGAQLKQELAGFRIGIHTVNPEMSIEKLITDEEIENNQDFFEQCAKDYRNLSGELIQKLADRHRIRIDPDFPLNSFAELKGKKQGGQIDGWAYFFHGYHCGFRHKQTGQLIETSFVFGLEFGELDPYFFTKFIKSTPAYQPLPVDIYEDYADGVRINEKMISLGLFETIPSNVPNHSGVVVTDRNKIEINVYEEVPKIAGKRKFSLLRFLGLR